MRATTAMRRVMPNSPAGRQLALRDEWAAPRPAPVRSAGCPGMCAACREAEARYGFRDHEHPESERPRTLCFACFRAEITRRQRVAALLARGWNAEQAPLPLDDTLQELTRRRRRAQIAARHALGA